MKLRLVAFALSLAAGAALATEPLSVRDPWVRATVPGQPVAGAYMELASQTAARLVKAETPVAASVEIHSMAMENGVMRMRALEALELPAGKPVKLASGGYHLMLIDLRQPLKAGDVVPIRLTVQAGGKTRVVEVQARVR